ncbi:MAG: flavin reductase family protein [Planctomycetota bacterium]|jgi:flavin reductase (DIM6/NTAB) family NADH-FMN oxidoreductase RutF
MLDLESLFKLSYGMCIISSKKDERLNGCIANTVFQVTPEPPIVAASINRQCLTHEHIAASKVFAVSILSQEAPMPFIGRFGFRSGRDIDKFDQVNRRIGQTGAPIVLDNTVASLEVEVIDSIDIFTHTLFIGQIVACETLDNEKVPMTYAYYRDIKHGRTPKTAATYVSIETKQRKGTGAKK